MRPGFPSDGFEEQPIPRRGSSSWRAELLTLTSWVHNLELAIIQTVHDTQIKIPHEHVHHHLVANETSGSNRVNLLTDLTATH